MSDPLDQFDTEQTPKGLEDLARITKRKKSSVGKNKIGISLSILPAHLDYLANMVGHNGVVSKSDALRIIIDCFIESRPEGDGIDGRK